MKNYTLTKLSKQCFGLGNYACNETRDDNGRVYIPVSWAEGRYALYSEDGGATFERREMNKGQKSSAFIKLNDGTYFSMGFENVIFEALYNKDQEVIPFCAAIYRAKTFDDAISGQVETSFANIDIPRLSSGFGDSGNGFAGCVSYVTQLSNGDIMAMMYGQFKDDKILCPYFEKYGGYKFYLYRVWTVVSHDMGKTWEFGTTVADCNKYPIADVNAEGYCEPYCVEVEPGHLCAILRTGGHEVVSPLYCTHSYDFGKTWEAPYEICSWGVLPKMLIMKDGTLVCASGHEHNFLMFSDDMGRTWSEPCIVEECFGKWGNSPSGYNTLSEALDGELTLVYDDPKELIDNKEGYKRQVYVETVRVEKN